MSSTALIAEESQSRLLFRAGRRRYALAASNVREIVRLPCLTPVPLAPRGLLGLGNIRGETLAVLSPLALEQGEMPDSCPRQLLVLDGPHRIALAIDAVERIDRKHARSDEVADLSLLDLIALALPARASARRMVHAARTRNVASPPVERLALLRMRVGDQSLALPVEDVAEVLPVPKDIARLPGADETVVGTIAWRDQSIGILSLAALLGFTPSRPHPTHRIVIVSLGSQLLGLLIDAVEGLLRVPHARIDPVPASLLNSESEARIRAICRPEEGGKLVSILAAHHLLSEARLRRLLVGGAPARPAASIARTERSSFLPVQIGSYRIGFPLAAIDQVAIPPARTTSVPGAPDWLIGIVPVDGEPIAIVDEVLRLTGSPAEGRRRRLLIVKAAGRRMGLLIDDVRRPVSAFQDSLEPAPLPEGLAAGIFGDVLQLNEGKEALLIVEPAALFSATEQALLADLALRRKSART